jgi:hypothetical protein
VREEVDVLVDDIETELGQMVAGPAVAVEGFPKGEMARDVGAHFLPRGEGGHVVVVYYNRKFRETPLRQKDKEWPSPLAVAILSLLYDGGNMLQHRRLAGLKTPNEHSVHVISQNFTAENI